MDDAKYLTALGIMNHEVGTRFAALKAAQDALVPKAATVLDLKTKFETAYLARERLKEVSEAGLQAIIDGAVPRLEAALESTNSVPVGL